MLVSTFAALGVALIIAAAWRLRSLSGLAPVGAISLLPRQARPRQTALAVNPDVRGSRYGDRARRPSVSVVVPALNEEESIDWVIDNIPSWVSEVVLVDGLSVDGTELVCTDRRDDVVVVHQGARGKGAALRAGFAAATGDIVVMIDADGSTDPREMSRFVNALIDGAHFVKGSRNLDGGGSVDFTLLRHLGNLGFVMAANVLFGVRFTDLCYGYCAFWRKDLDQLALTADGFEIEMELVLSAVRAGFTIAEVPSVELERRAGDSNLNAWKDGKRVLRMLLSERFRTVDPERVQAAQVRLALVYLPAQGTRGWTPAGVDRRRHLAGDRRVRQHAAPGYTGSERRDRVRRSVPVMTAEVLIAHSVGAAVVGTGVASPAGRRHGAARPARSERTGLSVRRAQPEVVAGDQTIAR